MYWDSAHSPSLRCASHVGGLSARQVHERRGDPDAQDQTHQRATVGARAIGLWVVASGSVSSLRRPFGYSSWTLTRQGVAVEYP